MSPKHNHLFYKNSTYVCTLCNVQVYVVCTIEDRIRRSILDRLFYVNFWETTKVQYTLFGRRRFDILPVHNESVFDLC